MSEMCDQCSDRSLSSKQFKGGTVHAKKIQESMRLKSPNVHVDVKKLALI